MRNNSYEQYLSNELERVKEENKELKDKLRVALGENIYYEEKIKDIMVASRDMSIEDKKHLKSLMVSAAGDLEILIFLNSIDLK